MGDLGQEQRCRSMAPAGNAVNPQSAERGGMLESGSLTG
jgi:hypothetical protein